MVRKVNKLRNLKNQAKQPRLSSKAHKFVAKVNEKAKYWNIKLTKLKLENRVKFILESVLKNLDAIQIYWKELKHSKIPVSKWKTMGNPN